jgi:GntR family transcriptional repressor for pyruvate dehydrogenase complex
MPNSLNIQKVNREDLYEQVVEQIEDLVIERQLHLGDRLPGERELCEQFGVSRNVIREATKVLAQRGMVSIEPGKGTFVTLPALEKIADSIGLFARARRLPFSNLVELRRALEPEIAALAAQRFKPEHVERLARCINVMERTLSDPEAYVEADQEFHRILAEATGNSLFVAITGAIVQLAQDARRVMFAIPEAPIRGQVYHRQLLKFVSEGNSEAARQSMLKHLQQVDEDIAAAFEKQKSHLTQN